MPEKIVYLVGCKKRNIKKTTIYSICYITSKIYLSPFPVFHREKRKKILSPHELAIPLQFSHKNQTTKILSLNKRDK